MQSNQVYLSQSSALESTKGTSKVIYSRLTKGILFLATVVTFLSAGFFYAWQVSSIPGFKVMDDITYIQAMNAINGTIRNAGFGFIFFGSAIFMLLTLLLYIKHWRSIQFLLVATSLTIYLGIVILITFTVHVPLNVELLSYVDFTGLDIATIRTNYESRWNAWHVYRTIAVVISAVLMLGAVMIESEETHK